MSAFYILFAYLIFLPSFANIPKYSGFLIPFLYGTKSGFPVIAYIPPIIAAITPWLLNLTERRERRDELLKSAEDGAVLQSGVELHRAKELQLKATKKDDTPFIRFGTSMGVLRKKGDNFAPDPKMPMGFTAKDALTHMIITGATGSGKTFNGFRPYAKQWIEQSCGGCVIMDGKGELASDLAKDIPAINIISPDTSSFSIVAGLSPEDVTLGIMETQTKESSNTDPLWDGLAETLLRYSAILLEGAVERDPDKEIKWTLYNIHQVVNNENFRQRCAAVIKDSMQNDEVLPTHLADAGNYWRFEFSGIPDKQRSSVITHVSRWLSPFLSNRELRAWAAEDDGIDITQALHGEVFGLCLPKAKYGLAGVAITNLAKMRLYNAAIKRGSHWQDDPGQTPCLIIIDEAQEVLADHDEEFPAIARSLGLALCYGTQTLDQFIERLKGKTEDRAFGFFEQFRSFMTFKSSKATYNYYSDRIGESRLIQSLFPQTAVDYDVALNQIAASPISDPNHPEKRALRKSRSVVFDALKNKTVEKMQAIIPGQQEDRPGERPLKNMEYKLVVEPHDFTDVLAGQYVCLCSFNRAGLDRRDFVVCDYKEE